MRIEDITQFIESEFNTFGIGSAKFPSLFFTGVPDSAVHPAGVSYLLGIGLEMGVSVISEYPITLHSSENLKNFGRIFPDTVWFHPKSLEPWLAFEFERFEKGDENKIRHKVENLVLSYYQSGESIELCVFIYWLRTSLAPRSVTPIFNTISNGFTRNGHKIPPPRCKFLVYKFVLTEIGKSLLDPKKAIKEIPGKYPNKIKDLLQVKEARKINGNTR